MAEALNNFSIFFPATIAGDEAALQQLIAEHPYFSPAYIAKAKLQADERNIAAAVLHAANPFWLHYLLHKKENAEVATTILEEKNETPISETVVPKEEAFLFEPLHTSDYFASQGIKISAEVKADDKLGRQLKSFTEWLKTMKKVSYQPAIQAAETSESFHPVLSMAEKSNTGGDVVTESMAEILAAQGKRAQAIEIYHKLSLLNPGKSAFFAAKIENLKED